MMRHTVTVEELEHWVNQEAWHSAASSHGPGVDKRLDMNNSGIYRVTSHGEIKYVGTDKATAVHAYNIEP